MYVLLNIDTFHVHFSLPEGSVYSFLLIRLLKLVAVPSGMISAKHYHLLVFRTGMCTSPIWQRASSASCTVSLLRQGLHVNQTMSLNVSIVKSELILLQFDQIFMTHP